MEKVYTGTGGTSKGAYYDIRRHNDDTRVVAIWKNHLIAENEKPK